MRPTPRRDRTGPALAAALALVLCAPGAHADPPVVSGGFRVGGIAAVVGSSAPGPGVDVILRSDVDLRARIALSGQTERATGFERLPPALLRATLDQLIGEALIAREAERVRVSSPGEADFARERRRLEEEAGSAARLRELLTRLGAPAEEVEALARRRALVTSFLQANLEGTTVVTDAEVEHAYGEGGHPFTDRALDEAREDLRAWLARRSLDRAVRRWVSVLRARTTVRVLVQYDGDGSEG
jgi:hypothetical protein